MNTYLDVLNVALAGTHKINETLRDKIRQIEAENERLRAGIKAVENLIGDSHGVYGLHLNGDLSPWDELLAGGHYEGWLFDFSAALEQSVPRGTSD